jgi:hypothetical protein
MITFIRQKVRNSKNLPFAENFFLAFLLFSSLLFGVLSTSRAEDKFMIIIIDGARYTETFGDPNYTYIPRMGNLSTQGTYLTHFYNDSVTYTSRAIPALWCGSWTDVRDTTYNGHNTQYAVKPTIFEYFRAQKNLPEEECFYVLKYLNNLWLPSFHPDYGPQSWPVFHSQGSSDEDVADEAQYVLNTYHPHFSWIYLADVDGAGHSGNWANYVNAIQKADSIVGVLWDVVQSDPFYQNSTYLFVTNDHGRHDNQHGGFSGHGDGCEGCRHIMFLALGPDIKPGYISHQNRRIPDMAVSAAALLNIDPEYATGRIMDEIIQSSPVTGNEFNAPTEDFFLYQNYPNPFNPATNIGFRISDFGFVSLTIYNAAGEKVAIPVSEFLTAGSYQYRWDAAGLASGVYFYKLEAGNPSTSSGQGFMQTKKMLLIR